MEETAVNGIYERIEDRHGLFEALRQHADTTYVPREIAETLKPHSCKTILHCACGKGILTASLAKQDFEVTATDDCRESLEIAAQRAAEQGVSVQFVHEDVRLLHKQFREMDAVVMWHSEIARFKEGASMRAALSSIYNCLRDGGIAIFETNQFGGLVDWEEQRLQHYVRVTGLDVDGKRGSIVEVGHYPVLGDPYQIRFIYILEEDDDSQSDDYYDDVEFAPIDADSFQDYLNNAGFSVLETDYDDGRIVYVCKK